MRLYYIVDEYQKCFKYQHFFTRWQAMKLGGLDAPKENEPVIMMADFNNEGSIIAWESILGIEPLPDPLTDEPLKDFQMTRLAFHLDLDVEKHPQTGKPQFKRKKDGVVLEKNHHTRMVADHFAKHRKRDWKFRVF